MKKKSMFTAMLLSLALSASAQVEFLYTDFGRNVICREKKLFWMDGDDDPCFNITNYKKTGNKETFNLAGKDPSDGKYSVTITLNGDKASHIVMKGSITYSSSVNVKTEKEADRDLVSYFRKQAGYADASGIPGGSVSGGRVSGGSVPSKESMKSGGGKDVTEQVGDAAKQTFNKVKGLFKKKK